MQMDKDEKRWKREIGRDLCYVAQHPSQAGTHKATCPGLCLDNLEDYLEDNLECLTNSVL